MTQKEALEILKMGYNVFLTGAAGSGKTYLLNQYITYLKKHSITVGITASTGIASTHMGGTTIHSWSGMGIKETITDQDIADLFKRPYLKKRFAKTKVLIIDEISMLHNYQLDMVDQICRAFKKNNLPFGGMQVIMCGDFFQLPPVLKKVKQPEIPKIQEELWSEFEEQPKPELENAFVTSSEIWHKMNLKICYLDEQHRQDDRSFLRVLNEIRNGDVTEDTVETLTNRLQQEIQGFSKPTKLYTHNVDVDKINLEHLKLLSGKTFEYFMSSRGNPKVVEILQNSCLAPSKLQLKIGTQVMFVKNNYEEGYVNGTLGEIIDFKPTQNNSDLHPVVRTFDGQEIIVTQASWEVKEEDREIAAIAQFPLRLAWAITIHKSQGMSLDAAEVDLSRSFIPGMGYVALSRVRSLQGLKLLGINQMALTINSQIAEIDREFHQESDANILALSKIPIEKRKKMQEDFLEYIKKS